MSHIKQVRKDIQSRRNFQVRQTKTHHPIFTLIYGLVMVLMLVASLTLGYLINGSGRFIEVNQFMQKVVTTLSLNSVSKWLPFEKWFPSVNPVSQNVNYQMVSDDYYTNNSNQAVSIMEGVVLYVSSQQSGEVVMVKQDNGVITTYGALSEVSVQANERILKGAIVGSYEEALYLEFSMSGNKISYEEALSIHEN